MLVLLFKEYTITMVKPEEAIGLMHWDIGGYLPSDIEVVAALTLIQGK